MKIILMDEVNKLGKLGDVVDVKKGYARNFLFPRNLAVEANDQNLNLLEAKKKKRKHELAQKKRDVDELAGRIANSSCTIPMTVGEDDKLFGSVTTEHIQEAFRSEGIDIDKKNIRLIDPIRKLGVYQVEIKLHPEVTTTARVWVVKK